MKVRSLVVALLAARAIGCRPPPPLPPEPVPAPPRVEAPVLSPARYFAADPVVIERGEDGVDRAIVSATRVLLRGQEIVGAGPADQEVDGGGRAPPWAVAAIAAGGAAPARYVFWKGKRLFAAESFLGPLHPLGALPQDPVRSFDWLGGTGLALLGSALVVPPGGGPPGRLGVAAVVQAAAADARRAVVVTALGHALYTADGGASYRDLTRDLGVPTALEARDGVLVATIGPDQERVIRADGTIVDRAEGRPPLSRRPPPDPEPFAEATGRRALEIAAQRGLPTGDGGVVVADHGFVGRFDPATRRTTSLVALDASLRDAECTPLRAGGAPLLACVGEGRAAVIDLSGAPRTERTFDLAGAPDLIRFVTGDDALGYLGPCDGSPLRAPAPDPDRAGDPGNGSRQQSPVFCVRAGKDDWVEHRLAPGEVDDLMAWIPRSSGGAVALLGRVVPFLDERERVQVRRALRVLRLARSEPPLALGTWAFQRDGNVDDSLRVLADDSVSGFFAAAGSNGNDVAASIDPAGHVRTYATPPHVGQISHAGPMALASGDDGRLWESIDAGQHWSEVDAPPLPPIGAVSRPSACSLAGCTVGGLYRMGWTSRPSASVSLPPYDVPSDRRLRPRPPENSRRSPVPPIPALRLSCVPAGFPEGRRIADSSGFGFTPQPRPRTGIARIGALGTAGIPWGNGPQVPTTGDVELGWVTPLDVAAVIHRRTLPVARLGLPLGSHRTYDLRYGYLLAPDGALSIFAAGNGTDCPSRLLEVAGVARPLGACAPDPSVGVDLGGRVIVLHPAWNGLHVSVAQPAPAASRGSAPAVLGTALREIRVTGGPPVRGISYGAGVRGGAPVVVVVDAGGLASLAPIDPELGTAGAEEPLRPLSEAALGSSPACAPRAGEARVVLPFEGLIAVDRTALRGVSPGASAGIAVLRWSRDRACLDAIELPIRDDRLDENPGPYDASGTVRKIVARFDRKAEASLFLVGLGTETRQHLTCGALLPGSGDGP